MMAAVYDVSALLAWLHEEPGGKAVAAMTGPKLVSTVNYAELVQRLNRNHAAEGVEGAVALLGLTLIPADAAVASAAGLMAAIVPNFGLSLADRFCLAQARQMGLPAITADRIWLAAAPALGVDVRLIR